MKSLEEMGKPATPAWHKIFAIALLLCLTANVPAASADSVAGVGPVPDTLQQRLAACTSCHGTHGEGSADSQFFPRLAGKPAEYLARQLRYFQDGQRKYAPMQNIVQQLDPDYLREIAEYFSAQQVPYQRSSIPTLPTTVLQRGEKLVTQGDAALKLPACERCHGRSLTGVEPNTPALVGLPYDYVSSQLGSWRTGTRAAASPDCMAQIANRLAPGDITAVSAWLASRQPPADAHAQAAGTVKPPLACGVLGATGSGA
jgi:cytochrome c553